MNMNFDVYVRALELAAYKHRHQRRKGLNLIPYINHPIAVTHVLMIEGQITDVSILCAALLHDTLEDTDTQLDELIEHFGTEIAHIVLEVTDDKSLPKATRKQAQIDHAPYLTYPAKLVKLADKICNVRDLFSDPPANWSLQRRLDYIVWAKQVVAGLSGVHAGLEAVFDNLTKKPLQ